MHKKILLSYLLFIFSLMSYGQDESLIYKENGKLKMDSTYKISLKDLGKWKKIEVFYLTELINNYNKNTILQGVSIEFSAIVELKLNKELNQFEIGEVNILSPVDKTYVKLIKKGIKDSFSKTSLYRNSELIKSIFIPITYSPITLNDKINEYGQIILSPIELPLVKPDKVITY